MQVRGGAAGPKLAFQGDALEFFPARLKPYFRNLPLSSAAVRFLGFLSLTLPSWSITWFLGFMTPRGGMGWDGGGFFFEIPPR